jgi:hypothetical protein
MSGDLAKQRFIVMQAVRLCGLGLALAGILIMAGKLDLPREIGGFLFLFGLVEALFLPHFLARRWKSPPQ